MSREEAIHVLRHIIQVADTSDCGIKEIDGIDEKALNMAIKALEQTAWIPVSERLPEADEYVSDIAKYYLVQNEYGDMLVARYTHSEYWEQIYQLKPIGDEIVAWMPLPESYKGD